MAVSAIMRKLEKSGDCELITCSRDEVDLLDQTAVRDFFAKQAIDEVYLGAAAFISGFFVHLYQACGATNEGTSPAPGVLEPTNEPYATAIIAGIKICESYDRQYGVDYRSLMPTNLYGQNDNFHPENSHVIPAMMRRFHNAAQRSDEIVSVWGKGKPMREFLHVSDMAAASVFIMNHES